MSAQRFDWRGVACGGDANGAGRLDDQLGAFEAQQEGAENEFLHGVF